MRFGFVTCVQLGFSCMEEIYRIGGRLDLAVTLKDNIARDKSGRIYLDGFCAENAIPLLKIKHVNDVDLINAIKKAGIDWLFIIGWSQIADLAVLDAPARGVLGMHPTLLPQGRGRASIPWAILKGLHKTGVTLFKLDNGVDTGPILAQEVLLLSERENATSLYARVTDAHRTLLNRVWHDLTNDTIKLIPQDDSKATVWPGRRPEDGRITSDMPVMEVDRLVRATTRPYPGAFIDHERLGRVRLWSGKPVISQDLDGSVFRLTCADGEYEVHDYEVEGKKR